MDNAQFIIILLLIFGLHAFIGFGILFPFYVNNRKVSAGICNHDMQHFKYVYKAPMTREQVLQVLNVHNETDTLSCTINHSEQIIRFEWYHDHMDYFFLLQDMDGGTLILLKVVHKFGDRSQVPSLLNPFMVEKLNALLLPYSEYKDAFWD